MNRRKKYATLILSSLLGVSLLSGAVYFALSSDTPHQTKAEGCVAGSLSSGVIDLNDTPESEIRSYYSSLNALPVSERQGTNLLKNLKPILKNMTYYSYDAAWKIYEITDREWALSPASEDTYGNYNAATNKYENYVYSSSNSSTKNNPYVHTLYRNRDANGVTVPAGRIREWGDHSQTGGTNREHVWCQSRGFKGDTPGGPAGTDIHHLMSGDGYVNGRPHNNNPYGYVDPNNITVDSEDEYSYCAGNLAGKPLHASSQDRSSIVFEPQDSDKGDIARACFYMVARYNNLSGTDTITQFEPNLCLEDFATSSGTSEDSSATHAVGMGIMSDLLEWNRIDPVDEYEIHRNNLIYENYQYNRNPFVDFPEWADLIWGNGKTNDYAKPASDTLNATAWDEEHPTTSESSPKPSTETSTSSSSPTTSSTTSSSSPKPSSSSSSKTSSSSSSSVEPEPEPETPEALEAHVTFATRTTDGPAAITDGDVLLEEHVTDNSLVSSFDIPETSYKIYPGVKGIKFGSSKAEGKLTLNLKSDIKTSVKSITLDMDQYGSDTGKFILSVNGEVINSQITPSNGTYTYTFNAPTTVNDITIATSVNRAYLSGVSITREFPVTSLTLDRGSATIHVGNTLNLQATIAPISASATPIVWSSSNPSVATVNGGTVTAVSQGAATITATAGGKSATCAITVVTTPEPAGDESETITINRSKFPSTLTGYGAVDQWSSGGYAGYCDSYNVSNTTNHIRISSTSSLVGLYNTSALSGQITRITLTRPSNETTDRTVTVYGDDNAIYSPGAGGTEYRILGDPIFSQTITFTSAANVITVTFPASCHYFAVSRPTEGVLYLESAVIKTDIAADANDWATAFLDATSVCDPTGATNNIDDELWLDQRYAYTCLSSKAQAFIHDPEALSDATQKQNVMNALARYRYILSKYGTEMYENFLGLSLGPSISEANRASSGDWTGGIALFGLVGIGAGSLLLLAKRRKKE